MVASRRCSGGGHAIRCEQSLPIGFGAKESFQDWWWEVDSIRDEKSHEFVPREEPLDDIVVPVQNLGHAVSQVRAEACSCCDGGIDLGFGGIRVAE